MKKNMNPTLTYAKYQPLILIFAKNHNFSVKIMIFHKFSIFLTHNPNPMSKNNLSYSRPPDTILGQN